MRVLGYPRLVSVENFRTPNFELVADVLFWMLRSYDPNVSVHEGIESEDDRVRFLTEIARILYDSANISLNVKRLYAADGYAVRELSKIAKLLSRARTIALERGVGGGGGEENGERLVAVDVAKEDDDDEHDPQRRRARRSEWSRTARDVGALASEITERGARLYDSLRRELEESGAETRTRSLEFLNALHDGDVEARGHAEDCLSRAVGKVRHDLETLSRQRAGSESDEAALRDRVRRKSADLERTKKRLASIRNIRPAFMDEYERLEAELKKCYAEYVDRYRNLDFLESQLADSRRSKQEGQREADRAMERIRKRMHEEEMRILQGEEEEEVEDDNDEDDTTTERNVGSLRSYGSGSQPSSRLRTSDVIEESDGSSLEEESNESNSSSSASGTAPSNEASDEGVDSSKEGRAGNRNDDASLQRTVSSSDLSDLGGEGISFDVTGSLGSSEEGSDGGEFNLEDSDDSDSDDNF